MFQDSGAPRPQPASRRGPVPVSAWKTLSGQLERGVGLTGVQQVGMVTSSCMSPMLGNIPVAMGYVKKAFMAPGKEVEVLAEGSRVTAEVVGLPLWEKGN